MAWNYRVMEFPGDDGPFLGIHEVYYTSDGVPSSYSSDPMPVVWAKEDGERAPFELLDMMREALTKEVLKPEDFSIGRS